MIMDWGKREGGIGYGGMEGSGTREGVVRKEGLGKELSGRRD
jgi:hypothetical protein